MCSSRARRKWCTTAAAAPSPVRRPPLHAGPPGLARLISSKSRGRSASRASPTISCARSRSAGRVSAASIAVGGGGGGEPSSPKVTCIGQVRMNKSKGHIKKEMNGGSKCKCFKKPSLFCGGLIFFLSPRRWRWGFAQEKSGKQQEVVKHEISGDDDAAAEEAECAVEKEEGERRVLVASPARQPATPPKNALLLMRGRSAPQHTPRFFVPPPPSTPSTTARQEDQEELHNDATWAPLRDVEEQDEEEEEVQGCPSSRALVLTRCKSAPAARLGSSETVGGAFAGADLLHPAPCGVLGH